MTEAKPKRRWFQFSLRTLFVMVTLFCIWLSCQLNWIRERHKFLEALTTASDGERSFYTVNEVRSEWHQASAMPLVQRILGEPAYGWIILPPKYSSDKIDRANYLFPEATIEKVSGYLDINGHTWPNRIDVTKLDN